MKKEFVELVVKDLEMLTSHLKELLVDEEDVMKALKAKERIQDALIDSVKARLK